MSQVNTANNNEYQVIARKYRPAKFADVVGQQHVVRTLTNAIKSGRLAHAYLFVGPRGIGKTTLARIFAKAMNCAAPENGEPCCQCPSCSAIAAESSLDVIEVDAASRNSTGDMRELAEDVLTRPIGGKYKIYIIDEVHMLSKAAWNVLLKTVEEPPAHVKFIFATTEVHQVLPTIISRCQRFDLMPIPSRQIADRLRQIADNENVAINNDAINAIARAAEGGMRDAQSLLDQMIAFFARSDENFQITGEQVLSLFGLTDQADLDEILIAMMQNNPGSVVLKIGRLAAKGKNLETFFDDLVSLLRAVQLTSIIPDPSELLDDPPEVIDHYRQLAAYGSTNLLQILLETLAPVGRVLHDALNKQVFLETIILKAMREAHAIRIDTILARLNQLRSAGELKFLDAVPAVTAAFPAAPGNIAAAAPEIKPAAVRTPAPEGSPAAVPEPPQTETSEIKTIPADTPAPAPAEQEAEAEKNVIPQEKIAEEKTAVVEAIPPAPPVEEEYASITETVVIDDADINDAMPPEMPVPQLADPAAAAPRTDNLPEGNGENSSSPDGRLRHSIANSNPEELHQAAKRPEIKEMLDLFGGNVIDLHVAK